MKTKAILLTAVLLGSAAQASAQQPQPDPDDPTTDADDPEDQTQPADPAQPDTGVILEGEVTAEPPPPAPPEPVVVVEPQPEPPTDTYVTVNPTPVRVTPVRKETTYVDRIGMSLTFGAGMTTFIDADTRDFTTPGGGWGARLAIGTRELLGLELGYSGTAQEIDALGLDDDAILLSNGVDAVLRLNFGPEMMAQPFIFGGMGWRHYNVTNAATNTSSVRESDDVLEFPVGAGLGFRAGGANIELRTTFRPVTDSDMIGGGRDNIDDLNPDDIDDPAVRDSKSTLHTWGASLGVGWDF